MIKLPEDKVKMLAAIDRFQALSPEEKVNFIIGRRVGMYTELNDLYDWHRRQAVERLLHRFSHGDDQVDDKTIFTLMEGFI